MNDKLLLLDTSDEEEPNMAYGFRIYGPLNVASFDPWTGEYLQSSFDSEFQGKELGNKRLIKQRVFKRFQEWQAKHIDNKMCELLHDLVLGEDMGSTRAAYLPMIRAHVVHKKYGSRDFDMMNYCPFCGAKLPQTLEKELTEILKNEYGLNSWRDYKNAPTEFHSDEWWRKREL